MKITLVRHGQTEYNYQRRIQGHSNILLNDEGRRQVKKIKPEINKQHYDICFSSPLIRTIETAMILVGDKTEIRKDKRLIERGFGKLEGNTIDNYDSKKYWNYALNCSDDNIEPIQDLFERCKSFLSYLKENYNDKNILVVTHGATLRALHHIIKNTDRNSNLLNFKIGNCYFETLEVK